MINHKIKEGLTSTYVKEVNAGEAIPMTGTAGILDYLVSTPTIFKMIIDASSRMLDSLLPGDYITIGKNVELCHEKPTMITESITINLVVKKIDGDRVYLEFTAHDSIGEICKGKYERVIVDKNVLMESAYKRAGTNI